MSAKQISKQIKKCVDKGSKILVMGNGGSSSETEHMVSEFVTHGIRAFSLNNPSTVTAIANDDNYSKVYSEQLKVLLSEGDLVIGLSTSGRSENILKGYEVCEYNGIEYIDWPRRFNSINFKDTARIQEQQLKLMHDVVMEYIKL